MYLTDTAETALDDYFTSAGAPLEGYWSPFVVLTWIASTDDKAVAAVQAYEKDVHANRGGPHTGAAWLVLSDEMELRYGRGFDQVKVELQAAGQSNKLPGAIARDRLNGPRRIVERSEWGDWCGAFANYGLELLSGLYDFVFPSDEARAAFPREGAAPAPTATGSRVGRKPLAGKFMHSDPAFVEKMRALLNAREVGSIDAAARAQWPDCGGQSEDAAERRLRRKYLEKYPN